MWRVPPAEAGSVIKEQRRRGAEAPLYPYAFNPKAAAGGAEGGAKAPLYPCAFDSHAALGSRITKVG